ncbi:MAG: GNAT family N-acetyltransferase [Persicimonas sp.]
MSSNFRSDTAEIVYDEPSAEDAEAIGALFYEDMLDLGVETTREQMNRLAVEVIDACKGDHAECVCWVARPGTTGAPCGVVLANFNWSLKFAGRALWIEELYVTSAYRRRGIGRSLVEQVLDFAEERGFKGVDLEAYQGNTPASVLYRTMGFHRLGRERFYYRFGSQEFL